MCLPLKVRPKKEGDSINLLIGNKKVSRLFIDLKIPKEKRDNRNMPTEDPYTGFPHYPKVEHFCEAKIAKVIDRCSFLGVHLANGCTR